MPRHRATENPGSEVLYIRGMLTPEELERYARHIVLHEVGGPVQNALKRARVLVVALSLLIGLDLIGQALAWLGGASEAEAVDRRLEHMDGTLEEPLLAVIGDYAIATSMAPPIPDHFYQRDKNKLDDLWAARQGSY